MMSDQLLAEGKSERRLGFLNPCFDSCLCFCLVRADVLMVNFVGSLFTARDERYTRFHCEGSQRITGDNWRGKNQCVTSCVKWCVVPGSSNRRMDRDMSRTQQFQLVDHGIDHTCLDWSPPKVCTILLGDSWFNWTTRKLIKMQDLFLTKGTNLSRGFILI